MGEDLPDFDAGSFTVFRKSADGQWGPAGWSRAVAPCLSPSLQARGRSCSSSGMARESEVSDGRAYFIWRTWAANATDSSAKTMSLGAITSSTAPCAGTSEFRNTTNLSPGLPLKTGQFGEAPQLV